MKLLTRPFRKPKRRPAAPSFRDQLTQQLPDASQQQLDIIEAVTPLTMTSPERVLALCDAAVHILKQQIKGDIVECGVWKGGSMAAVARTLIAVGETDRELWMYDTFEGMSAPTEKDVDFLGPTRRPIARRSRQFTGH